MAVIHPQCNKGNITIKSNAAPLISMATGFPPLLAYQSSFMLSYVFIHTKWSLFCMSSGALRAMDKVINPLLTWQPLNLNCWGLECFCRSMIKRANAVSHSNSSSNCCVYKLHSVWGKTEAYSGNKKRTRLSDKEKRLSCNFCLPNSKAEWEVLAVAIWDWYGFQFITDVFFLLLCFTIESLYLIQHQTAAWMHGRKSVQKKDNKCTVLR